MGHTELELALVQELVSWERGTCKHSHEESATEAKTEVMHLLAKEYPRWLITIKR